MNLNQTWLIERVPGHDFYTLTNARSNTRLELQEGNPENWTKVQCGGRKNTSAQHWYFTGNDVAGYRYGNPPEGPWVESHS
jgi:hypothetical protein